MPPKDPDTGKVIFILIILLINYICGPEKCVLMIISLSGKKLQMARVIRLQSNTEMVRKLQLYLNDMQMKPIPSESTLFRILAYMPSGRLRAMQGVNSVQDEALRGFEKIQEILIAIVKHNSLGNEMESKFKAAVAALKTYIKDHYFENLSFRNRVPSHCVMHALSDMSFPQAPGSEPGIGVFGKNCDHAHDDTCKFCNFLDDFFQVVEGMLINYEQSYDRDKKSFNVMVFEAKRAREAIYKYQRHLTQLFTQTYLWSELMEVKNQKKDPTKVYVTLGKLTLE